MANNHFYLISEKKNIKNLILKMHNSIITYSLNFYDSQTKNKIFRIQITHTLHYIQHIAFVSHH